MKMSEYGLPQKGQAEWINPELQINEEKRQPASVLRRRFSLEETDNAVLYITAHGVYDILSQRVALLLQFLHLSRFNVRRGTRHKILLHGMQLAQAGHVRILIVQRRTAVSLRQGDEIGKEVHVFGQVQLRKAH
jgi:hypothetical protein